MIHIYHYTASAKTTKKLDAIPPSLAEGDTLWLDLEAPTLEEEDRVFAYFKVHPLTLEDITRPHRLADGAAHLPKAEEFEDYLFVVVNPLPWHVCDPKACINVPKRSWKWRPQLSTILTETMLITHHYEHLTCVEGVRQSTEKRGELLHRGPDYLFHLILDAMVDEYAPVVERFATQLDRLELLLLSKPTKELLQRLLRQKRRVLFLRKTLIMEREVLARLVRAEFDLVSEREIHYYRNVYDHLVRYTELIEGAREMTSDLMQMQLAATSNRLNEVMKVLTMISTVVLPMTLIAGVYGMNFEQMPELHWQYGYPMALGLMTAVGVGALAMFKWKRWL